MAEQNNNANETTTVQNNVTENQNQQQQNNTSNESIQQSQQQVNVEKVKSDAIQEYLRGIGYDDDALKEIVEKHKKEEEENKTDLEKVQLQLTKITKELVEERKARMLAEAKLSALKLGAKADLVDDLVIVAMSRVTKEKSINDVVMEIKNSTTGSVYFDENGSQQQTAGKNLTGGYKQNNTGTNNQQQTAGKNKNNGKESDEDFIKRLRGNRSKPKKTYYKN